MRIAVLSDIHGNYQALESILEDIESQHIDQIISLGDNIGYGPEPDRVVDEIVNREIPSVMGNHELALFDQNYYNKLNFTTRESLDITRGLLSPDNLDWLKELDSAMVVHKARFVHACPPNSVVKYLFNLSEKQLGAIFNNFSEQICFAGHTHSLDLFTLDKYGHTVKTKLEIGSTAYDLENRYIFVPGSVGQPRDTVSDHAKYGIWDRQRQLIEVRAIPYNIDTTIKMLKKFNFPVSNGLRLKWQKK